MRVNRFTCHNLIYSCSKYNQGYPLSLINVGEYTLSWLLLIYVACNLIIFNFYSNKDYLSLVGAENLLHCILLSKRWY